MALFVSEFNFTVKHRAGKAHTNADGLTRSEREGTDSDFPEPLPEVRNAQATLNDGMMDALVDEMAAVPVDALAPGEGAC